MLINYSTARDKFSSCKDGPGKEKSSQVITVPDTPCLPPNPGQSKGPGFHFVAFSNERLSAFILFGNVVAAKAASLRTIFFFTFIEFIGVALANKIIQVSGVQVYTTAFVYCIVCHLLSLFVLFICFHLPPPRIPSGNHHTAVCVYGFGGLSFLNPFSLFTQFRNPPPFYQLSVCSLCL